MKASSVALIAVAAFFIGLVTMDGFLAGINNYRDCVIVNYHGDDVRICAIHLSMELAKPPLVPTPDFPKREGK